MDPRPTPWYRLWFDLLDVVLFGACCWLIWNSVRHPGPAGHSVIFIAIYAAFAVFFAARLWRHHAGPRRPNP